MAAASTLSASLSQRPPASPSSSPPPPSPPAAPPAPSSSPARKRANHSLVPSRLLPLVEATRAHAEFKRLYARHAAGPEVGGEPSRLLGLDCEMVMVSASGSEDDAKHGLARVSLVEYRTESDEFAVLVNVYVKPEGQVTDLLSHVSGISQSDLESASHTHAEAKHLISQHTKPGDVVVGHSLWSDFASLDLWDFPRVIDTSLLVWIKDAPRLTLALDDLTQVLLGEQVHYEGVAHDSIRDAEMAVRVALHLASLDAVPHLLAQSPPRFQKRITLHGFPASLDLASLQGLSKGVARPLKLSKRLDGSTTGSTSVDFESSEHALEAFALLPAAPGHHTDGHPDAQGFTRKQLFVDGQIQGEALAYCQQGPLDQTFSMLVPNNKIGKVMGKKGVNILAIQRLSGTQIVNEKQRSDTRLLIRATSREKVEAAVSMVTRAVNGEIFAANSDD